MDGKLTSILDWEVKEQLFSPLPNQPKMFKVLSRSDNNEVLGMFSTQYQSFSNADLTELCSQLEQTGLFTIEGYTTFKKGKKVLAYLKNNNQMVQVAGHYLKNLLIIGNAHDGSSKLFIGSSYKMLRCENQFSTLLRFWEKKHLINGKKEMIDIHQLIEMFMESHAAMAQTMERWNNTNLDDAAIQSLVEYLFPLRVSKNLDDTNSLNQTLLKRKNLMDAIYSETNQLGKSFWGVFNGITFFTTHVWKSEINHIGNFQSRQERLHQLVLIYLEDLYKEKYSI